MHFFATDFDDTLYFHDGRGLQDKDVEAIARFQKAGNLFGLNSGRSISMAGGIDDLLKDRVHFDFRVFANGSMVVDRDGNLVYEKPLPRAFVSEVLEKYGDIPMVIHTKDFVCSPVENDLPEIRVRNMNGDFSILRDRDVFEISFCLSNPKALSAANEIRNNHPEIVFARNSQFCDFNAPGTSKGIGLEEAARCFGCPQDETAAIGDSYNDISMIRDAAIGFTFPSSPEEVREAADVLVNGVGAAINFLMKEDQEKLAE